MDFETHISDCGKYVRTVINSHITYSFACRFMQHAIDQANKHDINSFLFDVRNVKNIESTDMNYLIATSEARNAGFNKMSKIGILINMNDDSHDFIETAAIGAGFNCKIFVEEDAATEWLSI